MEPSIALVTCEQALRQLMKIAYRQAYGDTWLSKVAGPDRIAKWRGVRTAEEAKRGTRGVVEVPQNELAYAEFYELRDIASKHWEPLAPALGRKSETGALLKRFDDLRNTIAHSREVLPFEADLLSGIAGEIRNRVTIYMSDQAVDGSYYPRIESVVDNLGNQPRNLDPEDAMISVQPRSALRPNDVVTFRCIGTDPQGRELSWLLERMNYTIVDQAEGNDVAVSWQVTDADVGRGAGVRISLTATDARYHRWSGYDMQVFFLYVVLPPD